MDNHQKTFKNIDKMYDKLTYSDSYGTSIFFFIIISIVIFLGISYCIVMINVQPIQENWPAERCKPYVIPFAGLINAPQGSSAYDYTSQNFQYCVQNIIQGVTADATQPLTFVVNILNSLANIIKESIDAVRNMFNKVRTQIQSVTQEIMGRLGNMMVPLQQIIISMRDMMGKVQGVMTASLYTLLGSYYTLQSLFGAIAQFIITILIALAATIIVLWLVPFTWALAASMTAVFIAIAIPMTIVLVFMMEYLHVSPSIQIPTIQCFDEDTMLKMENGNLKKIKDIQIGEKVEGGDEITTIFKVDASRSQMYQLDGIIVSNSHKVKYQGKWCRVFQHPHAIKITSYDKPYLYCLNTISKEIHIGNDCFSDWDEIINIEKVKYRLSKKFNTNVTEVRDIHKYLNSGFHEKTEISLKNGIKKQIQNIEVGDILENGEKVIGLVELDGTNVNEHFIFDLGNQGKIEGGGNLCVLFDLNLKKPKLHKEKRLFHLLTDVKTFYINNIKFHDYNASVDLFLEEK
jgi:hypothetical protein